MSKDEYEVGYGKPPKESQFKKGKSGNPLGRKKGRRGFRTLFIKELDRLIVVKQGGEEITVSMLQAMFKSLAAKAARGDHKATSLVVELAREFHPIDDEPDEFVNERREEAMAFFEQLAAEIERGER